MGQVESRQKRRTVRACYLSLVLYGADTGIATAWDYYRLRRPRKLSLNNGIPVDFAWRTALEYCRFRQ